ncbi:MAG: hypothetical protein AAF960_02895 [Bacteroidota bacterium]
MYLAPLNYDRFFKKIFSDERIAKQFLEDFFGFKIQQIETLPVDHKLTNEANLVSFDYRCKVNDQFIIIDMQQWYKHDVVKRFYLYHAANTVLQLEHLPIKKHIKEQRIKDYGGLLPVITLIWMVDDGLQFDQDYTAYTMLPTELLNFLENKPLWEEKDCNPIRKAREQVLAILNNDTKELSFLNKNQLIFAFQKNIVKQTEKKLQPYTRWFEFAEKTRNFDNKKEDFEQFEQDPVFSEIIRKLNHKSLNKTDKDYIFYFDSLLTVMEAKVRDSRKQGIEQGIEQGIAKEKIAVAIRCLKSGMSIAQTCTAADLSEEQVNRLRAELDEQ